MKNEYTIGEVKAEIAKLLKKHLNEYEESLIELRKSGHEGKLPHNPKEERQIEEIASSYEKKGKSPEQSEAIAHATVNEQHKAESCSKCGKAECQCKSMHKSMACKKCGNMMTKGETCSKCGDISAGKKTQKNEAISMMEKKGDKSAKGPQEIPDKTKEAADAEGAGGEIKKGKMSKAEEDIKLMLGLELMFKAEESSSKQETSEETSSPERGSHEETPEEEESEAKKSVHNMKGEMAKADETKSSKLAEISARFAKRPKWDVIHGVQELSSDPSHPDYEPDEGKRNQRKALKEKAEASHELNRKNFVNSSKVCEHCKTYSRKWKEWKASLPVEK